MAADSRPVTDASPANSIEIPITVEFSGEESSADADPEGQSGEPGRLRDRQAEVASQRDSIRRAVSAAALSQGFHCGQVGVMVTDDVTIQQINRRHLQHDYPTDVISFAYDRGAGAVQGELVVSLCTAQRTAAEVGWDWHSELLLYVIHGTLHICGLDDATAQQCLQMRRAEQSVLQQLGISDSDGPHGEPGVAAR
jgi:rRNA maturation RNase YbeY